VTAVIATGGMGAATWVQILKAAALLTVGVAMAGMVFWRVGEEGLLESAIAQAPEGKNFLRPGALISDPISGLSLALAFLFGAAGSPHILMRFFTVKDSNRAQISAMVAIFLIAAFLAVTGVLGLGAIALLNGAGAEPIQSSNEVIFQLSHLLGGPELLGIAAGATFATIIAVVSGLVIAGASAVSHDLYTHVLKSGRVDPKREVMVSRAAVGGIMVIAVIISLLFRNQNVGVIATLAITIAASANFPVLAAALYWRGLTTRGALYGSLAGLISSVGLLFLGPNVWVAALGFETPIFPYAYPTLFTLPFAAIVMFCVSWRDGRRADGA
ncbi:MAG: cation acetate symporter, partial [Pseudomonadota bacterium]